MKKIKFLLLGVCTSLFIMHSCQNDNLPLNNANANYGQFQAMYSGVTNVSGLLHFVDRAAFNSIYDSLNLHQYDSIIPHPDSVCLGGDFPFLDSFENSLNFTSLRRTYEAIQCNELALGTDPSSLSNHFVIDDIEATLLNVEHKVCIDDTVFYWKGGNLMYYCDINDIDNFDLIDAGKCAREANVSGKHLKANNCAPKFTYTIDYTLKTITATYNGTTGYDRISWSIDGNSGNTGNTTIVTSGLTDGAHTICVTIQHDNDTPDDPTDDCESEVCQTIIIGDPCTPKFDFSIGAGGVVQFTNQSTTLGSLPITSYHWDFGDGTSSNSQHPSHTYPSDCDRVYKAKLTIVSANCPNGVTSTERGVDISTFNCCDRNPDDEGSAQYSFNGGTFKIKWSYSLGAALRYDQRLIAKEKHFKYRNNKWEKRRQLLDIDFDGQLYKPDQDDCTCKLPEDLHEDPTNAMWGRVYSIKDGLGGFWQGRDKWLKIKRADPLHIIYKHHTTDIIDVNTETNGLECE